LLTETGPGGGRGYAGVGVLETVSRDTETGDPARMPALGTSDFDTQMCGIKFGRGMTIRPVYKEPFSEIILNETSRIQSKFF
jgi:hypothetical protein